MTGNIGTHGDQAALFVAPIEKGRRKNGSLVRTRDDARDLGGPDAVIVQHVVVETVVGAGPLGVGARSVVHMVRMGLSPVMINQMEIDEQSADQIQTHQRRCERTCAPQTGG